MLATCLPATGIDTWIIALLAGVALVLLVAGFVALKSAKARIAVLAIAPLALLGVAATAPVSPAQALESAYEGFTIPGWTAEINEEDPSMSVYLSDAATPEQEATLTALEGMVTEGTAVRSAVATVQSEDLSETIVLDGSSWFFWEFDYEVAVFYDDFWFAVTELENPIGELPLTVTFTYDYTDDCDRPLQTVIVYTGTIPNIPA